MTKATFKSYKMKNIVQTCVFLFIEDVDNIAGKYQSQGLYANKQSISKVTHKYLSISILVYMDESHTFEAVEFILKLK